MLKNAEQKSGFRRRGSQRFQIAKASFVGKENRFLGNVADPKNRSLRALSKRQTDRSTHIGQKKEFLFPNTRRKPPKLNSRGKRKSKGKMGRGPRRMDLSCFENIHLHTERREARRSKVKKSRGIGDAARKDKKARPRAELAYTRKSLTTKERRRGLRRKAKLAKAPGGKENIYGLQSEVGKKGKGFAKHARRTTNGSGQSIYEKGEAPFGKQSDWNYQSMKNMFKPNSPDFGGKTGALKSQNFQTLNPNSLIRSQEAKKRLQRPSISKMEKFGNFKANPPKAPAPAAKEPRKIYSKIFSKKEIENFVKANSNKCARIETELPDVPGKRNNLDEFFRNLELRSEKPLKPRPGAGLVHQVGKLVKQSCRGFAPKQSAPSEGRTSLAKKVHQTFESVEKKALESKKRESASIFETIYKDKVRPNSKNNNRRRKSSRTSGHSQGGVWATRRREDSGWNFRKISKWITQEKGLRAKNEALDIENSLYCKKNLKRIGQVQEFNVPENPKALALAQPSTMELKDAERKRPAQSSQAEVHISSFFKQSLNNSETDIRNSRAIKEETPEIQKQTLSQQRRQAKLSKLQASFRQKAEAKAEAEKQGAASGAGRDKLRIEEEDSEAAFSSRTNRLEIESPASKKEKAFFAEVPGNFQFERNFKDILAQHICKIMAHIRGREEKCRVKVDYFKKKQKQVDSKMREVLVDWLMEVHSRYKMRHETIFLAVRLIDKYLSLRPIEYDRFQLLGTASLMIAAKYEEIYPPKVKDFVYICANAYTRADVLKMEARILHLVEFDLVFPTAVQFFGFFQKLHQFEDTIKHLTLYILYGSLISQNFCQSNPRLLAFSAVIMANKAFKNYEGIKAFKQSVPGEFKDSDINLCIFQIYNMLLTLKKSELSALRTKFSSEKYGNISQIQTRVH